MARVQTAHHPPRGSTPTHGSSSLRASMPGSVFPVFSATQKRATPRRTARVNEHHTRFVIMPWMCSCTPKECGRIRAIAAAMLCVFCDHSPVMIGWPSRVKKYHATPYAGALNNARVDDNASRHHGVTMRRNARTHAVRVVLWGCLRSQRLIGLALSSKFTQARSSHRSSDPFLAFFQPLALGFIGAAATEGAVLCPAV